VYIACGTYTSSSNGAILCSYDGGRTFARVDVPFTMGGNENGRGNGERMMVDPQNVNIIYMGTRLHGLWRSTDKRGGGAGAVSFSGVPETSTPPAGAAWGNRGSGIAYDVQDAKDERDTRNIYVAVSLRVRKICSLATTMVKVGSRLGDSQCSTAPRIWS